MFNLVIPYTLRFFLSVFRFISFRSLAVFLSFVFVASSLGGCKSDTDKKINPENSDNSEEMVFLEEDKFLKLNESNKLFFRDYFDKNYKRFEALDSTDESFDLSFKWTVDSSKVFFFLQDSFQLEQLWVEDSFLTIQIENWEDYYSNYFNFFVFNKDSSLFLDWVSYSFVLEKDGRGKISLTEGEADQQIFLVDPDLRRRFRIYFSGPGTTISSGVFLDHSNIMVIGFVAAGVEEENSGQLFRVDSSRRNIYHSDEENNNSTNNGLGLKRQVVRNATQKMVPFILKIDLNERLSEWFQYVGNRDWTNWVQRERKFFLLK